MARLVDPQGAEATASIVLRDERLVLVTRRHWMRVFGTLAALVIAAVLVVTIGFVTPANLGFWSDLSWWVLAAMILYAVVVVINWRHDWFVATDKRLLLRYGLLTRRTAMMPLAKVTDMSFYKTPLGSLLGYGAFVMESAGQEQALHEIHYIPFPDHAYRAICHELFGARDSSEDLVTAAVSRQPRRGAQRFQPLPDEPEQEFEDDTDVPIHRLGAYLDRRTPPKVGGLRHRLLRGPQAAEPTRESTYEADQSWSISHEDASPPQRVRPDDDDRRA